MDVHSDCLIASLLSRLPNFFGGPARLPNFFGGSARLPNFFGGSMRLRSSFGGSARLPCFFGGYTKTAEPLKKLGSLETWLQYS